MPNSSMGIDHQRFLQVLAQDLKVPLMQIARQAELARLGIDSEPFGYIENTADMAIRMIDSYILSIQLQSLTQLDLEPVSVSALLQDTAHQLSGLARQYNCELEVDISGRYEPAMAHARGLSSAFTALGYSFIAAAGSNASSQKTPIRLHVRRQGNALLTGVFTSHEGISNRDLRTAQRLAGNSYQTLPRFSAQGNAGVFIADALLGTMQTHLRAARRQSLTGLVARLFPSEQLALV